MFIKKQKDKYPYSTNGKQVCTMIKKLKAPVDYTALLFVLIMTFVLSFPLYILSYKYMPSIILPIGEDGFRIDDIILFTVIAILLFFFIKIFRKIFVIISLIGFLVFITLNFSGVYTLENLYRDYNKILYDLGNESLEKSFFYRNEQFTKEEELRKAINYNNPVVVQFARNKATTNFQEYRDLVRDKRVLQYFSIFKEIRSRWVYVFDPLGEDFYSPASETIKQMEYNDLFKGDCDDYSILMAAAIRAVGGEVKLVRTNVLQADGSTIGHLYPEVKVGDKKDFDNIAYLIKSVLFPNEVQNRPIRYFQDPKGYIWLNFDYNDQYPGGRYQSDIRVSETKI